MTIATWDVVYGRPSISKEALWWAVALALHMPLLFMRVHAPSKQIRRADNTFMVRDLAIEKIMSRVAEFAPPPRTIPREINLRGIVSVKPVAPPPLPVSLESLGPVAVPIKTGAIKPTTMMTPERTMILTPDLSGGVGIEGKISVPKIDKGNFAVAANSIAPIDSGGVRALKGKFSTSVSIPMAANNQTNAVVPAPIVTPFKKSAFLSSEVGVPVAAAKISKGAKTPAPIQTRPEVLTDDDAALVVPIEPRTLTPEQRMKELFPIKGALQGRAVERQEMPEFPESVRRAGGGGSVKLRFSVTADGRVMENVGILKGSGFPELDEAARSAILRWIFARLPPEKGNMIQEGTIEFRFSLK